MNNCPICKSESCKKQESYWVCGVCDTQFNYNSNIEFKEHIPNDEEKQNAKDLANKLARHAGNIMLDIGCNYPYLAFCFKELGIIAFGLDNLNISDKSLNIPIIPHSIESWEPTTEKYNLVTMINTFEYILDPVSALRKIRSVMDFGATLFIKSDPGKYNYSTHSILECLYQLKDCFILTKIENNEYTLKAIIVEPLLFAAMMVKNEERDLPVLLESLKNVVNGIVAVDTGSTDRTIEILHETTPHVYTFLSASEKDENGDWQIWDFSAPRNYYLNIVKDLADWVINVDADDKILDPEKLRRLKYYYAADIVAIKVAPDLFTQHRMWQTNLGIKYAFPCHEYPTIGGYNCLETDIRILHNYAPGSGESSNKRNMRILQREYARKPDSRTTFYLAETYRHGGIYQLAARMYGNRIDMGQFYRDEWLFAHLYKARSERALGQVDLAIDTLLKAIVQDKEWAEFWMELAYIYYDKNLYHKCISCCYMAMTCINKPTGLWREPNKYTDQPRRVLSFCEEKLGKRKLALHWALAARDFIGPLDVEWNCRIAKFRENRIALIRMGAMGDVIMTLNLIVLLKKKYPEHKVDYYTSEQIKNNLEFLMKECGVDEVYASNIIPDIYQHKFNLTGYPLKEGYPYKKMDKHLIQYFADELGVEVPENYKIYLSEPNNLSLGEYITIHPKAGWSEYKNWPKNRWEELIRLFPHIRFYQLGAKDDPKIFGADHFYMGTSIDNVLKLMTHAKLHIGVDSFTNHLTNFNWGGIIIPAIILWGSTQWDASGYKHNINISKNLPCQPCFRESPYISKVRTDPCPNRPSLVHECMYQITVEEVAEKVKELWSKNLT